MSVLTGDQREQAQESGISAEPSTETVTTDPKRADAKSAEQGLQDQPRIPLDLLVPDPDNVRVDLDLNEEFLASLRANGIEVPILITPHPDQPHMGKIVEGHRRYFGAREVGLDDVPYTLTNVGEEAEKFAVMYRLNHPRQRRNHNTFEQLAAIRLATSPKASKARIRKVTGWPKEMVDQAQRATTLSADTLTTLQEARVEWTFPELSEVADFEDGSDFGKQAVARLKAAKEQGHDIAYMAELLREERRQREQHEQLIAEFEAAGVPVAEKVPAGGLSLDQLLMSREEGAEIMTAEAHQGCPGRGVCFPESLVEPKEFCADPEKHGHGYRHAYDAERLQLRASLIAEGVKVMDGWVVGAKFLDGLDHDGEALTPDNHRDCPGHAARIAGRATVEYYCLDWEKYEHTPRALTVAPAQAPRKEDGPSPKEVRAGNIAWAAAAAQRRKWLVETLFRQPSAPKGTVEFTTRMLMTMPKPLEDLNAISVRALFTELVGKKPSEIGEETGRLTDRRLQLLTLALIVAALERQIFGDNERRFTWRTDRENFYCPREVAGAYLSFLQTLGYRLSPIEEAVASGAPYTGESTDALTPIGDEGSGESSEPASVIDDAEETATGGVEPADDSTSTGDGEGDGPDVPSDGTDHNDVPDDEAVATTKVVKRGDRRTAVTDGSAD